MNKLFVFVVMSVLFISFGTAMAEEKAKKIDEKTAAKIEKRSPLSQVIDYFALVEAINQLKVEEKDIKKKLEVAAQENQLRVDKLTEAKKQLEGIKILFENDKSVIVDFSKIDKASTVIKNIIEASDNANYIVVNIEGFADGTGTDDHNLVLSYHRASATIDALTAKGIPAAIFRKSPYGIFRFKRNLTPGSNSDERAVNFVVENVKVDPSQMEYEILAMRLRTIQNTIRELKQNAEIRFLSIEFPYKGKNNKYYIISDVK